jgi:L-erythro-3,5-diaminohexanoate dehydrogenase
VNWRTTMPDPYGLQRVVKPQGVLPQVAEVLDPSLPCRDDEVLIDVDHLNIDAASFRQIEKQESGDTQRIADAILGIIRRRGKMQNPVTGSGGMLIGRVREVGPNHPAATKLKQGDRIATLVSLTLTPLAIERIEAVHPETDRVDVRGHAILFASGIYARLPADLSETLALAALDVCGAPAHVARLVKHGSRVLVVGAGKSGGLCCAQAKRSGAARVVVADLHEAPGKRLVDAGLCHAAFGADATRPVGFMAAAAAANEGRLYDLVVSCTTAPGAEMSAILACRDGGAVVFFSMATSFAAAALGAEGVGKDAALYIGNGYAPGHADLTLDLLRSEPRLRSLWEEKFSSPARQGS